MRAMQSGTLRPLRRRSRSACMKRSEFRFLDRLRVRWAEIDAQKIVFNGHYLMYFDTAIAGYWRALAMPYAQTMEYLGGDLYVRKATVEYEASAHYDDVLSDIRSRDARDSSRDVAPLRPATDAIILDTSDFDREAAVREAVRLVEQQLAR